MEPKTNRETLKDAVREFDLEYDYNRIDAEMLGSLDDLSDDFMAAQEAAIDHLTDAEIDRLIAEERGGAR